MCFFTGVNHEALTEFNKNSTGQNWLQTLRQEVSHSKELQKITIPLSETNSSPLKIGLPKRTQSSSNHQFPGAKMLVSGRVLELSHHYWSLSGEICVDFYIHPRKLEEELPEFLRFEVVTFLVCVCFF